jgi:hypothetical protein
MFFLAIHPSRLICWFFPAKCNLQSHCWNEAAAACNRDRVSKQFNNLLLNMLEKVDILNATRTFIVSNQIPTRLFRFGINIDSIFELP